MANQIKKRGSFPADGSGVAQMFTKTSFLAVVILLFSFFAISFSIHAQTAQKKTEEAKYASLSVSPSIGTFTVGNTFSVSILLNTGGLFINAIDISLLFPADKLQIVSPSAGQSVIGIWTSPPKYDNQKGTATFRGGIPNPGINVESGLVSTITFRVKAIGTAAVRFSDNSRIFLNDGLGTNILGNTMSGIYSLTLPLPAGPEVSSFTHPDQTKWYPLSTVQLQWQADVGAEGYSYMLSATPIDIPDDIPESMRHEVIYRNLISDGIHYFHIKELRSGAWGGTTHFGFKIDTTPPAEFPVQIIPSEKTVRKQPVVQFVTTDAYSGISHYELKIVPLTSNVPEAGSEEQQFFIEASSPYVPSPLDVGKYLVVVRAFDNAGNYRAQSQRLEITTAIFEKVAGEGIRLTSNVVIPWVWVLIIGIILAGASGYAARRIWIWHRYVEEKKMLGALKDPAIQRRLRELQERRKAYGKILILALFVSFSLFASDAVFSQTISPISPPIVTIVSDRIANNELFYIGGKTEIVNSTVIVYLQSLQTGETMTEETVADKNGDWFYSYPQFLVSGRYLVWIQSKVGEQLSPPGPQIQISVTPTALQIGSSRLSYETLYFGTALMLFIVVVAFALYGLYHFRQGRRKHQAFLKEVHEAEESLRRGFAIMRNDIEAELATIHKIKLHKKLSEEEIGREKKLLEDLEWVRKNVEKEVWDIERAEEGA